MTTGVFLLTRMTPMTGLLEAISFMVIAGIGVGPFFSVLTIAAQNARPRTRLGIGTSAVRYLGQLGAVVGVAVVGTMVNNTLADDIARRIPSSVAQQLIPNPVDSFSDWSGVACPCQCPTTEGSTGFASSYSVFGEVRLRPATSAKRRSLP
jgi:hypothetical protein